MVKAHHGTSDTICGPASSATAGGVAIVRISGADARPVLAAVAPGLGEALPSVLKYTAFVDADGASIDAGYAVYLPGPRTYTGEDVVELFGHGGAVNVGRLLRAVQRAGARFAERGEFTLRAFLNGRLDLARAEAVLDVVQAPTETALDLAHAQLRGGLSREVVDLADTLLAIHARLAAQIDFVDEDLEDVHQERFEEPLVALAERVGALAGTFRRGRVLRQGARVVLLGAPNAGKSSLFNALLRTSRAIVTDIPGTTRDFLEERAELAGVPVTLIDTAGLRDAPSDPVEAAGVERSLALAERADLVLLLSAPDAPAPPRPFACDPTGPSERTLKVATKCDLGPADGHAVSVVTGEGLEELAQQLASRLLPASTGETDLVVTSARHHEALVEAEAALRRAADSERAGRPADLVAVDVMEAETQLGFIVGRTTTEDLLDRVFSQFCIGK